MAKKLQVEYVPIEHLKTYERNAKLHPAEQVEQIKKSIEQFGMNDPIAVWKDNVIIEGHGRLIALKELGYEKVPVIRLDELTDAQRRAYALAHNKLTMNSDFDFSLLSMELEDLEQFDFDMGDFGFDSFEESNEEYIDDFFERGVEANEPKPEQFGCRVIVNNKEEQESLWQFLKDNGYNPQTL